MLKTFKRILSFFTAIAIILPVLFCSDYRVLAEEMIYSVVMQADISKPESGEEFYYAKLLSVNGNTGKKQLVDEDRTYFNWYRSDVFSEDSDDYSKFDEVVFESGKYYNLYIKLFASDTSSFSKNCTLTLKTPEGTYKGKLHSVEGNGLFVSFDLFFYVPNELIITKQPVSKAVKNGEYVTLTTEASGDGVTYQWWVKNPGDKVYSKSSVASNIYTTNMTKEKDGRILRCVIKDKYGNLVRTDIVTISIQSPLVITKQPVSKAVKNGEYVTVTTEASGDGVTYQWWVKNPGDEVYTKSSVASNTYTTNMTKEKDGRILRCVIKDKHGNTVRTDIVTITMRNPLVITKQPVSKSAKNGEYITLTTEASGDGVTYQWWVKNPGDEVYTKSSVASNTYTTNMTKEKDGRILRCVIKDKHGNLVRTDIVKITMQNPLVITKQPVSKAAKNGEYVTLTTEASGDGVTYQWWIKNPGDEVYTKSSVTSSTYTTNMTKEKDGRILRCVIKDKHGNLVRTDIVKITMQNPLVITKQPVSTAAKNGEYVTVTTAASGDGVTYQWWVKNPGDEVYSKSSVTSNTYTTNMTKEKDGRILRCVIKDKHGNMVKTDIVKITVK